MEEVLDLFKAIVVEDDCDAVLDLSLLSYGYVLPFHPTEKQKALLVDNYRNLGVNTLFSAREARNSDIIAKIEKQLHSYSASYWLNQPSLFVEHEGETFTVTVISSITKDQLQFDLIDPILYGNKPARKVKELLAIIKEYNISFNFDQIKNNEIRIGLYNENDPHTQFKNGDDVVRYIVFKTTDQTLLIKSKEVLAAVKANASLISAKFLKVNSVLLSQVFNRHKNILLSLKQGYKIKSSSYNYAYSSPFAKLRKLAPKGSSTSEEIYAINQIARMSKHNHKPLPVNAKTTILSRRDFDAIDGLSVREKFRLLNHIEYVRSGAPAIFTIRNGKLWFDKNYMSSYSDFDLIKFTNFILSSLQKDLAHLKGKTILLPKEIDYGLPISQKQAFGNLPWGTTVEVKGRLSSGIFWRNSWGARDLDLSTLDANGGSYGWGRFSGYRTGDDVSFSGDLVSAPDPEGAMEFMTSSKQNYGLFVNVFSGQVARCDVVVGDTVEGRWIKNPIIQEKVDLPGRGTILGYVDGKQITLFSAAVNQRISTLTGDTTWSLKKRFSFFWTTKKLLKALDISFKEGYDVVSSDEKNVVNLSYSGFTFDKLEALFFNK